jgi:hypothetical protein
MNTQNPSKIVFKSILGRRGKGMHEEIFNIINYFLAKNTAQAQYNGFSAKWLHFSNGVNGFMACYQGLHTASCSMARLSASLPQLYNLGPGTGKN